MDFVTRFRAKASKAAQAQSKLKQVERMDKIAAPTTTPRRSVSISAAAAQRPEGHHAGKHSPGLR